MQSIVTLLWIKIVGTALGAALPMLATPEWLYAQLGFPPMPSMLFLRLYGLSTTALLVGYWGGIEQARRRVFPRGVLRMGLVSNGGQGLAIVAAGATGAFTSWGWVAQVMMWSLGAFILCIAAAIAVTLRRSSALPSSAAPPSRTSA